MYEGIIETLIRFFAIVTNFDDKEAIANAKLMVISYLKENFESQMATQYLELYEEFLNHYHVTSKETLFSESTQSISSNKLTELCEKVSTQFDLERRFLIIIQLLNFIHHDQAITEIEQKIVDTIAHSLKVNKEEYQHLSNFYLQSIGSVKDKANLFVVNGSKTYHDPEIKHLYRANQEINLEFIRIQSINGLFFKYNGPRNLYLNGHRLVQNRLYIFPQGGILKTSRIIPIYYSSIMTRFIQKEGKPLIVFNAENIAFKFGRKRYGIHPFSFQERSGDLVAIMGGSGVGKTTLLNVLNGKLKPSNGKITINGLDLHNSDNQEELKGIIGYVPQDDFLIEELTVYQNLEYNARFCFGNMPEDEIQEKIELALNDFDLVEARDLVVGNPLKKILSGGQRKRLNIALELIREPSILFADEPTSGLSSADSEKVMYLLKKQCLKQKLVIVNIHQPSSAIYKLFDRIMYMDKGGRIVFFGNPRDAVTYFKNEANYINPDESECMSCGNVKTDQPLKIIEERMVDPFGKSIRKRKVSPEEWYRRYQEKVEPKVVDFMKKNPTENENIPEVFFKPPGWFTQMKLFMKRDFATKKSNRQYMSIAIIIAPVLALILGFFSKFSAGDVYSFGLNDNIPAFLFMSVVVALFIGLTISAEEIFKDRKILKREEFLELSRGAYFTAKVLILFSISAIQMLAFVLIGHYMLEFRGLTISTWLILFSCASFANMLGLNLSSGLNTAVTIYVLIPLLLVPQLLLSGVIVNFNKMHPSLSSYTCTPVIGDAMASRWGYEALAVNQYKNNKYRKDIFDLEQIKAESNFQTYYWLPQIEGILDTYYTKKTKAPQLDLSNYEAIVSNAVTELISNTNTPTDSLGYALQNLSDQQLKTNDLKILNKFLQNSKTILVDRYKANVKKLDQAYRNKIEEVGGNNDLMAFKNKYSNNQLEAIVREKINRKKTYFYENGVYQGDEPIYRTPVLKNGRAHFYAAYKYLGVFKIDTVIFNLLIIWLFTFFLMFTLYFDVLRKILAYIEHLRLNQLNRLRDKIFYNPKSFIKQK